MSANRLQEINKRLKRLPPEKLNVVYDFVSYLDERQALTESMQTALASEAVLARDWDTPEEDEAWADL
jgi:hypothetical protein